MRNKSWLVPLALFALATLTFAHVLDAEFLRWDDRQNLQLNPFVERALWSQTWTRVYYNMYIPVTYSVWTILWHITPEAWLYHLLNLVLHGANVVLAFVLLRRAAKSDVVAGFAAALFAIHPIQVETVAWISTGRDLLSVFFGLLAVWVTLRTTRPWGWITATLLFGLALLSKPSIAVLPVAALGLAWAAGELTRARRWIYGLWLIPGAAALISTKIIQQLDADLRVPKTPLFERVLVTFDTLGFYLTKLVWPVPLAADYGRSPKFVLEHQTWIVGLVLSLGAAALVWRYRGRFDRVTWFALAWPLVFFGPVLGLVPFQAQGQSTTADRYAYLPLLGLALLFGRLAAHRPRWAAVLIVGLVPYAAMRAEVWRFNGPFFHDMLDKNPTSFVANSSLGVEYILSKDYPRAETYLNEAVRLKPSDVIPRTNLAQLYILLHRPDRVTAEIAPLLNDAAFLRQNQTETRALASAYRLTGRAYWMRGIFAPANEFYCRWFRLDYENEEGKGEVQAFMDDAKAHQVVLPNCQVATAFAASEI